MLYPNFKELLNYEKAAKGLKSELTRKFTVDITGNFLSSFKGQGMEFDKVRPYVYGDDVRDIDWRVSARTQQTHIKVYQEERKRNVLIAVDNNDYMNFGTRSTFKNVQAARAAALIGFAGNNNNDKVGMYIYGNQKNRATFFKPVNSKKSLFSGLKTLCDKPTEKFDNYSTDGAIFNLRRIGANPNILFIISDFRYITEELGKNLYLLGKKPEIVFINLFDDSDYFIPDVGQIVLEYEEKKFLLNTSNRRAIERYKKMFQEKHNEFRKLAIKMNARIININTKDDIISSIITGMK